MWSLILSKMSILADTASDINAVIDAVSIWVNAALGILVAL